MESLDATLERLAGGATPWKSAARVVATSSITLSGLQTIDGVALAEGDRVLAANGSAASNGLWVARSGPWERALDLSTDLFAKLGMMVPVLAGTTHARSLWMLTSPTTGSITLGVTALSFTKLVQAP